MLKVLYEDNDFIGFYKPPNIPTTYGKSEKCFINEVKLIYPQLFVFEGYKKEEGGLLYRLDNETSGLLLFAKNKNAFLKFINDNELKKIYYAFVSKLPNKNEGIIDKPIAHKSSKKMIIIGPLKKVNYRGKIHNVITYYKKIDKNILECYINKGIRHQIRIHLASIGCPIIGDSLYGGKKSDQLMLFCVGIKSKWLNIFCNDFI